MAEVAPAAPPKAAKKKTPKAGPTVSELILEAVTASNEKSGVSLAKVKSLLTSGGYDVEKNNARVKTAVKKLVISGKLVQTKGSGASGSFKIAKTSETKAKKPAAKKPATKVKKPKAAKKPKASPKKAAAKKSPTKAKKPAAKKTAVKKPAAKKAAVAKKSPAKRVAKPKAKKTAAKKK